MEIPDHLICLLRNLHAGQEATVRTRHGYLAYRVHHVKCQAGWSSSWNKDCWEKYQQPQICRWYNSNGRNWRGTQEPLDEGERGQWRTGLKFNIQKTNIMASSPIISWQIDEETMETVTDRAWASILLQMVTATMKLKHACPLEEKLW